MAAEEEEALVRVGEGVAEAAGSVRKVQVEVAGYSRSLAVVEAFWRALE